MLVELSITPLGGDPHISDEIAEALKLIDASGLPYQLTPSATCIEGEWDEVMALVRQCHDRVREKSPHVITTIKIEDEEGATGKLTQNVASVEKKVGHALRRA
ncbi:MAG TPA: MTH1187 family thiamine-binding protein [Blastocatellia bacterium]|nr:MTH1187 family thiamine-binding protein [Blastocatellia bacterium]